MVLGGRLKGDKGAVLVYESGDLKEWKLLRTITTPEVFGYMCECPDYFELDGEKILSVQNLSTKYAPKIQNVSFDIRKGEIFGFYGLVGAGRTELL